MDRLDRIPYILNRWNGSISLGVYLKEGEMNNIDQVLSPYLSSHILWTFYVVKEYPHRMVHSTYVKNDDPEEVLRFDYHIFPINLIRDLAIESIHTTHFLFIDIDFFISSTIQKDIWLFRYFLSKPDTIFLIPTFTVKKSVLSLCRRHRNCESCNDWTYV